VPYKFGKFIPEDEFEKQRECIWHKMLKDDYDDCIREMTRKELKEKLKNAKFFAEGFKHDCTLRVADLERDAINEGIDVEFKFGKNFISLNDTHEKGVDTSLKANPTSAKLIVDEANFDVRTFDVYSIFKRVSGNPGDGNSLIFALKGERNFMFKHGEQQKFRNRAKQIIAKFLEDYLKKTGRNAVSTIVLPSGKSVNSNFAKLVKEVAASKLNCKMNLYDDVFVKLPVDFIRNNVQYDAGSQYNRWLHSLAEDRIS